MDMPEISLLTYVMELKDLIRRCKGRQAAEYLSLEHHHSKNSRILYSNIDIVIKDWFDPLWEEVVYCYVKCIQALNYGEYVRAFEHHFTVVQSFGKIFRSQKDVNWALPIMFTLCSDIRSLATKVDLRLKKKDKPNEMLGKVIELIMGFFQICVGDNRCPLEASKRWGILNLTNQLFKIYFKVNKLHLLNPLIRMIEGSDIKDQYPISERVTYKYFLGQQQTVQGKFKEAEENLSFAFLHCRKDFKKNKRLILIFLIPVKMVLGIMPSMDLLEKYDLMQFAELVKAVKIGNVRQFEKAMESSEVFFIKWGISLVLEKLRIIIHRNLFKKVFLLFQPYIIPVRAFTDALNFVKGEQDEDEEIEDEETLCILSNLIQENKIRGYISYEEMKVVFSELNAFPPLPFLK